jgi:TPR repeat protein
MSVRTPKRFTHFAVYAVVFTLLLGAAGCMSDEKLYAGTANLFRSAAERGDPGAQTSLAGMYDKGVGVPKDYALAAYWYGRAAEQGDNVGQIRLGAMYGDGEGVPQDNVKAYMWLSLASLSAPDAVKRQVALQARDMVAASMTPEQIAGAQRLANEWKPQ